MSATHASGSPRETQKRCQGNTYQPRHGRTPHTMNPLRIAGLFTVFAALTLAAVLGIAATARAAVVPGPVRGTHLPTATPTPPVKADPPTVTLVPFCGFATVTMDNPTDAALTATVTATGHATASYTLPAGFLRTVQIDYAEDSHAGHATISASIPGGVTRTLTISTNCKKGPKPHAQPKVHHQSVRPTAIHRTTVAAAPAELAFTGASPGTEVFLLAGVVMLLGGSALRFAGRTPRGHV